MPPLLPAREFLTLIFATTPTPRVDLIDDVQSFSPVVAGLVYSPPGARHR
jgi:hypothetical protein